MQTTLFVHTGEFGTGIDIERLDSLDLKFADAKLVVGHPDNGLRLPHGGVIKGVFMESRRVAVWGASIGILFDSRHAIVVELALVGTSSGLRSG